MPLAYIAARIKFKKFSQQITAPMFPNGVSNTGIVEQSPNPQTSRSEPVGMTLRCLPR